MLHWAERFINFFPRETKLYVRGARGADWAKSRALEKELFDSLVPFLDRLKKEARAEMATELADFIETAYLGANPEDTQEIIKTIAAGVRGKR